jgi:hypothetical protein
MSRHIRDVFVLSSLHLRLSKICCLTNLRMRGTEERARFVLCRIDLGSQRVDVDREKGLSSDSTQAKSLYGLVTFAMYQCAV